MEKHLSQGDGEGMKMGRDGDGQVRLRDELDNRTHLAAHLISSSYR